MCCRVCDSLRDCVLQGPSSGLSVEAPSSLTGLNHGNAGLILPISVDSTF